jgi:hypothetical protein
VDVTGEDGLADTVLPYLTTYDIRVGKYVFRVGGELTALPHIPRDERPTITGFVYFLVHYGDVKMTHKEVYGVHDIGVWTIEVVVTTYDDELVTHGTDVLERLNHLGSDIGTDCTAGVKDVTTMDDPHMVFLAEPLDVWYELFVYELHLTVQPGHRVILPSEMGIGKNYVNHLFFSSSSIRYCSIRSSKSYPSVNQ